MHSFMLCNNWEFPLKRRSFGGPAVGIVSSKSDGPVPVTDPWLDTITEIDLS